MTSDLNRCDEFGFPITTAEALHLHRLRVIDLLADLRRRPPPPDDLEDPDTEKRHELEDQEDGK